MLAALLIAAPGLSAARGGGHSGSHSGSHSSSHSTSRSHGHSSHSKAQGVHRDSHGKIARSQNARNAFKRSHPCPSTGRHSGACPGYVIDHIRPLKRGGADEAYNMQWQTRAEARAKDRYE
ncbi:MAG: HNH endonuclease signature motif containing protein [Betaproteobacteria bacterium]